MAGLIGTRGLRRLWRLGVPLLLTGVAWLATYLLTTRLQTDAPFIFFPLAVICSAYLAGTPGGLISTTMGALLAVYFFLPPEGFGVNQFHDQIHLLLFVFLGGAISLFAQALQLSQRRTRAKAQALSESEDRLRMAADAVDVGVWYWDLERDELTWSDKCKMLFGLPPDAEVTLAKFFEAIHPDDRDRVRTARRQALLEHEDYDIEFRAVRPDGDIRWIMGKGRGVYDERGQPIRMHGVAMDTTQRRQMLEQLQTLNETLEQRVAERTAVAERRTRQVRDLACELTAVEQRERRRLAEILHDHLQQLLVGARFSVSLLQSQTRAVEASESVRQVDDLLRQSLEVTRTLTIELSPPALQEGLIPGLQWLAEWMRDRHGLRVDLQTDGKPDPQSREVSLLLFQCVRELLFNISKHAKVDRATVRIDQADDVHLRIMVCDEGIGFDPKQPPPSNRPGSGFGLTSVRERLELIDGCVRVDTSPGTGTRITLEAPLQLQPAR